ncbi:DUF4175 domain-containing protein [Pontibacter liquoris]|uniref:DUF4175 domain-containing protein n=1 Tax=Pontibacter liquoris TaxID=2905677 RepID=UPI001FA796B0|nr:DUF4175 domain-containing protein [Pontibacter liquoris]
MAVEQSISILRRIRSRYVQAKLGLYGLQALAIAAIGAAILYKWRFDVPALTFAAGAILVSAALYLALRWRQLRQTDLFQVARHLNRRYPQLEDSTELLLQEPQHLLGQLQQQKTAAVLLALHPEKEKSYTLRSTATYAALGLALVVSAGILYLPAALLPSVVAHEKMQVQFPDAPPATADTTVTINQTDITITPPAYTGKPAYKAQGLNLRIEEGATVSWRIQTSKPARRLQWELNGQPPVAFRKVGEGYAFSRAFSTPGLYTITLNGRRSAFYTLEIIPDEAPVIRITKPAQYTDIRFGDPQRFTLQAQLSDDYGLREANIVATVAKGSGEAVTFKEQKLSLGFSGSGRSFTANKTVDLKALGMTYGDELYFYVQAWDKHRGYTRSETYLVQLEDTALAVADFDMAMSVNPVPAYFRSQRQIIIDTEKLLAEQKSISAAAFEERSNTIGVDQKLLRLRYGKFLGEEAASGIGPGGGIPVAEEAAHTADDGHDHAPAGNPNSADALLDPYIHKHDQEDEATIFEPAVKAKLKGALAQMWEAELRLRTYKPREALPYEYKALRMLKDVQQSTRAYVAKTGFEVPPFKEPELRLTGELDKITPLADNQAIKTTEQLPHTRAALAWLAHYKQTGKYKATDAQVLEKAGQELASQALQQAGSNLRTLQEVRTIISDMQNNRKLCASCLMAVERAWVALLPPAAPTPQQHTTTRSPLAKEYQKRLHEK